MSKMSAVVVLSLSIGGLVTASPDSDWAYQQKAADGTMVSFNAAFGTNATVVFDRHLKEWPSVHDMAMACTSLTPSDMCDQSIATLVKWGSRLKITRDGLKRVKTIACHNGDESKITIKGSVIDMEFKGCDVTPYSTHEPTKALTAAFPNSLYEEAVNDEQDMLARFNDACGAHAVAVVDNTISVKAVSDAYGANVGDVCKNGLDYGANACSKNPKIKAALATVKTYRCDDKGTPPDWRFKLAGGTFTATLSAKPITHRVIDVFLEKAIPGAKAAWTIPRQEVEGM